MRLLLDCPQGYGLRFEFLRHEMSTAEQAAYFDALKRDQVRQILVQELQADTLQVNVPTAVSRLKYISSTSATPRVDFGE
jgi:hypothetical protein